MRILSVTAQKPDSTGSGTYLTELVNSFKLLGHTQAVIAGINVEDTDKFIDGVLFYPVRYNTCELPFNVLGMSDSMPYESTRYKDLTVEMVNQFELAFIKEMKFVIESFKPDIIICHHLYFLTAIIREHFPKEIIFAISHGTDLRQLQKIDLDNDRIKKNISNLNHIFALHQNQKEEISRLYNVNSDKITVIGSGYNDKVFYDRCIREKSTVKKIIFAGKICEKKGVISLLQSLNDIYKHYTDFELYLAGGYSDKNEYNKICNIAENCKFNVTFLGKLNQEQLANRFNQSDIFVLASFFEGLPLVIIEALACGLKVVATDLPGVKQWISDNIGVDIVSFVPPPVMKNVDEPDENSLNIFEDSLSNSIYNAIIDTKNVTIPNTENVKWNVICQKILSLC
ncbi:MAG: glycosyltransferase family 4 protein [Oscillospiraceae bacterium]